VLPNGASTEDLCYRRDLEAYIRRHVLSWYQHIYGTLGLEAGAGPLYLITGHDKSNNWCLGSYGISATGTGMSLRFIPTDLTAGGTVVYSAHVIGNIDTRTHVPEGDNPENQCIFIRGYKMTLCRNLMERIFVGQVKISDIVPPKPGSEGGVAGNLGATALGGFFSWLVGGNRGGNQQQRDAAQVPTASDGLNVIVESFPDLHNVRSFNFCSLPCSNHSSSCIIRQMPLICTCWKPSVLSLAVTILYLS
jgi:hypothetical protein